MSDDEEMRRNVLDVKDISDDSEDDSSSDEDDDVEIDADVAQKIMELETKLEENPNLYEQHVEVCFCGEIIAQLIMPRSLMSIWTGFLREIHAFWRE